MRGQVLTVVLSGLLPAISLCLSVDEWDIFMTNGLGVEIKSDTIVITSTGGAKGPEGKVFKTATQKEVKITIPFDPTPINPHPKICLPNGIIGLAVNGVPIYNPYTSECCDAGLREKEKMDGCWGKLDKDKTYYYNVPPLCAFKNECGNDQLVGVALDGFPIYGPYDETGKLINSSMLDECHGRDDARRGYRYHVTTDFPYMVGCFRSSPVSPSPCGCESLSASCGSMNIGQRIVEANCCPDASSCSYTYNTDYNGGFGSTFGQASVFLVTFTLFATTVVIRQAS